MPEHELTDLRLLIVEDDADDAALVVRHIEHAGYRVSHGRVETPQALAAALGASWDAILLDFRLPQLSGLAALQLVREADTDLPVLIVSGTIGEEAAAAAMRSGAADFIPKGKLDRLVPALEREMRDRADRRLQRQQETELRETQERFRATFEQAAVGMAHGTIDGRVLRANEKLASMLGYTPAEMVGRRFSDLIVADDAEQTARAIDALLDGETDCVTIQQRALRLDGTTVWTIATYSLAMRPGRYVICVLQDITHQKAAEQALRVSEARFRRIFDSNVVGVFFWSVDGRVADANDAYLRILGYDREELLQGKVNWREITPPEWRAVGDRAIKELRANGVCPPFEKEYYRKDGSRVRVLLSVAALDGDRTSGVTIMVDLTERERAFAALRASEARFRSTLENSYDITTLIGSDGKIAYVNPSVRNLLGWTPEELIGTDPFAHIHPDDAADVRQIALGALSQPDATAKAEYRHQAKDGTWRWLESVGRYLTGDPDIEGVVINSRDVTERRAYQRQLDQAARVSSLGRLAATMAHEFNNVLMGIQPFAEVIRRSAGTARVLDACTHIENSVRRGRTVSQEILRFTQPAEPAMASVGVMDWLNDVTAEMSGVFGGAYELTMEVGDADLRVSGDRAQITQAVTNLAVNARDAMPCGGAIVFRAEAVEREGEAFVDVQISDRGTGIPDSSREHIFTPLFTTKKGGTGLGLAITHQIVTRHGGFISYENKPSGGTTFHMLLPRSQAPAAQPAEETAPEHKRGPARVLIVEDEEAIGEGLNILLDFEGFDVRLVTRGLDAAQAAEELQPDVAIVDIGLPDISGEEVGRILTARFPSLAVVFSTGHGDATQLVDICAGERSRCIQKPYESSTLLSMIDELLAAAVA